MIELLLNTMNGKKFNFSASERISNEIELMEYEIDFTDNKDKNYSISDDAIYFFKMGLVIDITNIFVVKVTPLNE